MYKRQVNGAFQKKYTWDGAVVRWMLRNPVYAGPVSYTHLDVYKRQATGLTVQSQNWLSNLVNDDWSIAKIITAPPYDSAEHYKKALVNISSINYLSLIHI